MAVRQDADEAASMDAAEAGLSGASSSGVTAMSFSGLYEALGKRLVNERTVLLLYDTLQTCPHFQNYVFVRRRVMTLPGSTVRKLLVTLHSTDGSFLAYLDYVPSV